MLGSIDANRGAFTYGFYGFMSILSFFFVWKIIPETKGRSLKVMEQFWRRKSDRVPEEPEEFASGTKPKVRA